MLKKLIQYDLKSMMRVFVLIHAAFLAICVCARFLYVDRVNFHLPAERLVTPLAIAASLLITLIVAVNLSTWLLMAFRFYKNLFSGEGYLSWTLPASGPQHLLAKTISGYICMLLDTFVIGLGILILFTSRNVTDSYRLIAPEMTEVLGMTVSRFAVYTFLFCILSCISTVVMTYFCITVGQLFPGHRVLCAIAAYFVTYFVIQFLLMLVMAAFGYFPGYNYLDEYGLPFSHFLFGMLSISTAMMLLATVIQYIVTHHIMKKNINLL